MGKPGTLPVAGGRHLATLRHVNRRGFLGSLLGAAAVGIGSISGASAITRAGDVQPNGTATKRKRSWLFVQSADKGSWRKTGDNLYELVLAGVAPSVIAFTDRPNRDVDQPRISTLFPTFGFNRRNPPNAALVVTDDGGNERSVVVELTGYDYNAEQQSITYSARTLKDPAQRKQLAKNTGVSRRDFTIPEAFSHAALLIDDCANGEIYCRANTPDHKCGYYWGGFCYSSGKCTSCGHHAGNCANHGFAGTCTYFQMTAGSLPEGGGTF